MSHETNSNQEPPRPPDVGCSNSRHATINDAIALHTAGFVKVATELSLLLGDHDTMTIEDTDELWKRLEYHRRNAFAAKDVASEINWTLNS